MKEYQGAAKGVEREGQGAVGGSRILPRGHLELYQTTCLELYQPAQEIPFKLYRRAIRSSFAQLALISQVRQTLLTT